MCWHAVQLWLTEYVMPVISVCVCMYVCVCVRERVSVRVYDRQSEIGRDIHRESEFNRNIL